jgi:hypothetical protein
MKPRYIVLRSCVASGNWLEAEPEERGEVGVETTGPGVRVTVAETAGPEALRTALAETEGPEGRAKMEAPWLMIPLGTKADLVKRRDWDEGGVRMRGGS